MGTLRYAVLGLLNRNSMTGYELTREFNSALSEFWSARHSQIYPELKALAKEQLVTFEIESDGGAMERKRYTITPAGRRLFLNWERTPLAPKPTPKDEFRLQLFFSDCLKPRERFVLLTEHLEQHLKRLAHLEQNREILFGGRGVDALVDRDFSDYLVLSGAIEREQATCHWLEQCLNLCSKRDEQ